MQRYGVDNQSWCMVHCWMLICSQVYLAMTGDSSIFDAMVENQQLQAKKSISAENLLIKEHNLVILRATDAEELEHRDYLELLKKQGECVWDD